MSDAGTFSPAIAMARNRWRGAEDRLYPTLIADPTSYRRAIDAIQAVVGELRMRCSSVEELIAIESAPEELIAAALPNAGAIPVDMLIGVACGMADREIAADRERTRREAAIAAARAAGNDWVLLGGPALAEEMTEGRRTELHLPTNTVVETTVDPWSGDDPFQIEISVITDGRSGDPVTLQFADRTEWLAELVRRRAGVESGSAAS